MVDHTADRKADRASAHPRSWIDKFYALAENLCDTALMVNDLTHSEGAAQIMDGLWWETCRELVRDRPEILVSWRDQSDPSVNALWKIHMKRELGAEAPQAAHSLLTVGICLAQQSTDTRTMRDHLASAAEHWRGSGLLPDDTAKNSLGRLIGAIRDIRVRAFVRDLGNTGDIAYRYLAIQAALMSSELRAPKFKYRVPVLFDTIDGNRSGETGVLQMAVLRGGPPGLYPDPRTMSFLRADSEFAQALSAALLYASSTSRNIPCVIWRVEATGKRRYNIEGGSLGAAFAALLYDISRRHSVRHLAFARLRSLRPRRALTGKVQRTGEIEKVEGLAAKLKAAQARELSVIAPAENQDDFLTVPPGLDVQWVSSIKQARRKMLYLRRRQKVTIAVLVALICGAALTMQHIAGLTSSVLDAGNQRQRAAAAQQLLGGAESIYRDEPMIALQYALAALALTGGTEAKASIVKTLTAESQQSVLGDGEPGPTKLLFGSSDVALVVRENEIELWDARRPSRPSLIGRLAQPVASPTTANNTTVNTALTSVALSPDGTTLLEGRSSGEVIKWDISDRWKPRREIFKSAMCLKDVVSIAFSRSNSLLIGCGEGAVDFWDLGSRQRLSHIDTADLGSTLWRAVLSDDGTTTLISTERGFSEWNTQNPKRAIKIADSADYGLAGQTVSILAFGPDSHKVLLGTPSGALVLNLDTDKKKDSNPLRLSFAGREVYVGAGGWGGAAQVMTSVGNTAIVWDLSDPQRPRPRNILRDGTRQTVQVALSPDGRKAMTSHGGGKTIFWDLTDADRYELESVLQNRSDALGAVAMAGDSKLALLLDQQGNSILWDANNPERPLRIGPIKTAGQPTRAMQFHPSASVIASASEDGAVLFWDSTEPARPKLISEFMKHKARVNAISFSGNGMVAASAAADGNVIVWDLTETQAPRLRNMFHAHEKETRRIALSADGRTAVTAGTGGIRIWDLAVNANPQILAEISDPPNKEVIDLSLHPAATMLLVVRRNDQNPVLVDLRNARKPQPGATLEGHSQEANSVSFSADGGLAVTTSADGTANVWSVLDAHHIHRMATLTGHVGPVLSAAFGPSGSSIVTGSADQTAIVWNIRNLDDYNDDPKRAACALTAPMSAEEWKRLIPEIPPVDSCAGA